MKTKNPAAGKRQGLGIATVCDKPSNTAAHLDHQPNFDAAEWLARRARVSVVTARVFAEIHRFGEARL